MNSQAAIALGLLSLAGCELDAPIIVPPGNSTVDGGSAFADTVIDDSTGGVVRTCSTTLPACGDAETGPCYPHPALGPNDGMVFTLGANDLLEVAFRCGFVEHTGSGADFKIWATVPDGAAATVDVSYDGSSYSTLGGFFNSNPTFDLDLIAENKLNVIRFVRIRDNGTGGIGIDAVESLQ